MSNNLSDWRHYLTHQQIELLKVCAQQAQGKETDRVQTIAHLIYTMMQLLDGESVPIPKYHYSPDKIRLQEVTQAQVQLNLHFASFTNSMRSDLPTLSDKVIRQLNDLNDIVHAMIMV